MRYILFEIRTPVIDARGHRDFIKNRITGRLQAIPLDEIANEMKSVHYMYMREYWVRGIRPPFQQAC